MTPQPYGPGNPHPLSTLKTELVWEGKYDEYGNRRPVHLPSTIYPLQRIESIDEPRDRAKANQLSLFDENAFNKAHHPDDFRNMLIWGDNKLVMASLLEQFRGMIDLIYIDPPFDVGADFSMSVPFGGENEEIYKEQSILETVAYRDMWGNGKDSYLNTIFERIVLLKELLCEEGNILIHVDYRVVAQVRLLLDYVFGVENFKNELIWHYHSGGIPQRFFPKKHDTILWYSKTDNYFFDESSSREPRNMCLECGTKVDKWNNLKKEIDENGRVFRTIKSAGKIYKYYDDEPALVPDVWLGINHLQQKDPERTGYATQKPEKLVSRIIGSLSPLNGTVADFFCGSGTTMAVAEKLGRRWIGVDLGRYAVHTSRKRLIQVQRELQAEAKPYRAFDVYNLGRYERQWWQLDRLKGADQEHRSVVLKFYKASPLKNPSSPLLHGSKPGLFVHVDQIDGYFTFDKLLPVAQACAAAGGRELHILAWEFEMELTQRKQAVESETHVEIRLKYIPREIMEANRTEVQFFEAGALQAKVIEKNGKYDVALVSFSPALAEAPEKEMKALRDRAVKTPFDFIDFWAVDFEWTDDQPFEHHWQDFRTRKERTLLTKSDQKWEYRKQGKHKIAVKVIDVFGVDTTTVIDLEV